MVSTTAAAAVAVLFWWKISSPPPLPFTILQSTQQGSLLVTAICDDIFNSSIFGVDTKLVHKDFLLRCLHSTGISTATTTSVNINLRLLHDPAELPWIVNTMGTVTAWLWGEKHIHYPKSNDNNVKYMTFFLCLEGQVTMDISTHWQSESEETATT